MDYVNINNKRKTSSKNVNIVPFGKKRHWLNTNIVFLGKKRIGTAEDTSILIWHYYIAFWDLMMPQTLEYLHSLLLNRSQGIFIEMWQARNLGNLSVLLAIILSKTKTSILLSLNEVYYYCHFSYGHQHWAITFSRHDKSLGVYLVWKNPSEGMKVFADFSITLLNRHHYSENKTFSAKNIKYTGDAKSKYTYRWLSSIWVSQIIWPIFIMDVSNCILFNFSTWLSQVCWVDRPGGS